MSEFKSEVSLQGHEQSEKLKRQIWLITPEQFAKLPNDTRLTNLWGEKKMKGDIDEGNASETRHGFLAYGFSEEDKPEGIEFDKKAMFDIE